MAVGLVFTFGLSCSGGNSAAVGEIARYSRPMANTSTHIRYLKSMIKVMMNLFLPFVTGVYLDSTSLFSIPPRLGTSAEIIFRPVRQHDLVCFPIHMYMSQFQGQWSGSTYNGSFGIILRSVAGAFKLLIDFRPRHHTSKVRAN